MKKIICWFKSLFKKPYNKKAIIERLNAEIKIVTKDHELYTKYSCYEKLAITKQILDTLLYIRDGENK